MLFSKDRGEQWLIVGLGNPGQEYTRTRHNTGFLALDLLAGKLGVKVGRSRFRALTGTASYHGKTLILMKPQTYMNASGMAVEPAAHFYHIPPERVLVLFDDISLPVGRVRVRGSGSAGGHNGLKSIIHELGSDAFPRVKIGVGAKPHPDYDLADWVLSVVAADEQPAYQAALQNAAAAALCVVDEDCAAAAAKFNGKVGL